MKYPKPKVTPHTTKVTPQTQGRASHHQNGSARVWRWILKFNIWPAAPELL